MDLYAGDPVIGFRSWRIDNDAPILRARMTDTAWNKDTPTKATCIPSQFRHMTDKAPLDHEAPNEYCSCGIYGWYDSTPLNLEEFRGLPPGDFNDQMIFGTIVVWGRIHFHEFGFKAEYAKPVALTDHNLLRSDGFKETLRQISREYEIPIMKDTKLASYTRRWGIDAKEYL